MSGSDTRRAYHRAYYHRTKERRRELAKNHKVSKESQTKAQKSYYDRRKALIDAEKQKPCADCGGEFPPVCMDFHHLRDKKFGIGASVSVSLSKLRAEMKKCEIVCANCHRLRHKNNN